MPWDDTARRDHARRAERYASDLTEREWSLIAPFLPPPRRQGRPRTTDLREVMNAILYMASAGCQWRMLPKDLPPPSTVQRYFYDWRDSGLLRTISNHLVMVSCPRFPWTSLCRKGDRDGPAEGPPNERAGWSCCC